jgi:hypothetical protein
MLVWLACGFLASGVVYALGTAVLGMSPGEVLGSILASNVAGLIGLLVTLALERQPVVRRRVLTSWPRTWTVLSVLYFGLTCLFSPPLREGSRLLVLGLPLIFTNGLLVPTFFGPIQDWIIRRGQRRELHAPN